MRRALAVPAMGVATALVSGSLLAIAGAAWIRSALALPYSADMLIVIREATRRFLDGGNPYATYSTYDAPWDVVLPYGPLLWGPYLLPQAMRIDLRLVTVIGELAVPLVVAVAATLEAARGRLVGSTAWLALLVALVGSVQVTDFTLMGHTAAYWPLFPLFAWFVTSGRWLGAALTLGCLVVARTTMVALVPVLLFTLWQRQRLRFGRACLLLAAPGLLLVTPFALWDPGALWSNMATSYPRIVKSVVWPTWSGGLIDTMGVTGWLVARHHQRWVEVTQALAMMGTYALAWWALRRGAVPLPWMAAALAVFSMAALWPVFYLYFDVLLLLASGAATEVVGERISATRWAIGLGATALAVLLAGISLTEAHPTFTFEPAVTRSSFALPRRTRDAAMIEIDYQLPDAAAAVTTITATLNGHALAVYAVPPGRGTFRVPAPAAAWWRGFNRLDLMAVPSPPAGATVGRIAVGPYEGSDLVDRSVVTLGGSES